MKINIETKLNIGQSLYKLDPETFEIHTVLNIKFSGDIRQNGNDEYKIGYDIMGKNIRIVIPENYINNKYFTSKNEILKMIANQL